jgi:ketol-acid reductoisomerase
MTLIYYLEAATAETNFEKTVATTATISEQEYFDNGY